MQDQDFDKLFARKIEQAGSKSPNESEWAAISNQLDAHDRRRSRLVLPVLLALLALLAGSNVYWWQVWRTASKDVSLNKNQTVIADTIIRRTVILQYDTIHQITKIQYNYGHLLGVKDQKNMPSSVTDGLYRNGNQIFPGEINWKTIAALLSKDSIQKTENQTLTAKISELELELELQKSALGGTLPNTKVAETFAHATTDTVIHIHRADDSLFHSLLGQREIEKNRRPSIFHLASPDLGISYGLCIPQMPGRIEGYGRHIGVAGSAEVMHGWRLGAAFTRQTTDLKSSETSIFSPDLIPDVGSEYLFKYWEISEMQNWEWSLGLRREWRNKFIFKPYLGVALRGWQVNKVQAKFEYDHRVTGIEKEIMVEIPSDKNRLGGLVELGGNIWLNKNLGLSSHIFWRTAGQHLRLPDWGWGFETRLFHRLAK